MDATLCFGGGHTLHAMHAGFVFEDAVNAVAGNRHHHLFVSTDCTGAFGGNSDGPSMAFAEFQVHFGEVAGEESGFVAAGACTDFEDDILVVLRVARQEE